MEDEPHTIGSTSDFHRSVDRGKAYGCYYWNALGVETVHHGGKKLEFVLNGMREEICID